MFDDLHYVSLHDVSHMIRTRQVSAVEVTRGLLDRIERYDGQLHSFHKVLPERALKAARQADREIGSGLWRGPLHGVPIGLKDLVFMKGLPTGAGTSLHRTFRPTYDATVVTKLETAGAVVIGKLHMTEGATLDHHPSLPRPENPWLAGRWTGVSSSGSGVAPAAGLCYGAIGTDTAGSIRVPSACCGLSGIKPTWGRVSRHGLFPLGESLDHVGPMARSIADAAAILQVIAGSDVNDPTALSNPAPGYQAGLETGVCGLVIGVDWAFATDRVEPAVVKAFTDAIAVFEELGAHIQPVVFPPHPALDCMPALMAEVSAAHEATFPSRADDYGPSLRGLLEGAAQLTGAAVAKANMARLRFNGSLSRVFDQVDILATPTLPRSAPTWEEIAVMGRDVPSMFTDLLRYMLPFDLSGSPALSLPCGFDALGLPLGLQLVGRNLQEELICRAGHAYQCATDFHTRRSGSRGMPA